MGGGDARIQLRHRHPSPSTALIRPFDLLLARASACSGRRRRVGPRAGTHARPSEPGPADGGQVGGMDQDDLVAVGPDQQSGQQFQQV
jgi:hypothetical protein